MLQEKRTRTTAHEKLPKYLTKRVFPSTQALRESLIIQVRFRHPATTYPGTSIVSSFPDSRIPSGVLARNLSIVKGDAAGPPPSTSFADPDSKDVAS
ncbi:hypothetical protein NMY22_g18702 [Coprinellus aureogranulatus]|nr:hypothetical protein NMY22_g18702 [Coprinellus aureogranulatus]